MKGENSFFSFFSNIKDKINSFFTSVTYSSKNEIKDLNYLTTKKQDKSTENNNYNNYLSYLIRKKQKNNFNTFFHQNKIYYNLSSTFSEILSKENYDLNDTQTESNNDNESIMSFYNNNIEENYYLNNSNILGKKHNRYQFEEEKEIKNGKRDEKNYNDVKRLSDEFISYKKKLKLKNKINKKFRKTIKENEQINIKKINKKPFNILFSTNPERFSLYSTQKKMKLDKKELNTLSITIENNIMFLPCEIKDNKENENELKQEEKIKGKINISPAKSCEISKIINISNDFSFRKSYDTKCANDLNLSTLIDDNNNNNSSYEIKKSLEQNNIFSNNNTYNNSFIINNNKTNIDLSMDIEEYNPLIKNQRENDESKKNIKANSFQTTNNNPFLFPNNKFEKKIENNAFNNNENANNNKPFFEGKNLFNINGNNNNISSGLNFSFGKV